MKLLKKIYHLLFIWKIPVKKEDTHNSIHSHRRIGTSYFPKEKKYIVHPGIYILQDNELRSFQPQNNEAK